MNHLDSLSCEDCKNYKDGICMRFLISVSVLFDCLKCGAYKREDK